MLPAVGNTPHDVLAVLRAHAARAAGAGQLFAIGAQPLSEGQNNAAYKWESPDGPVCVKVYRVDGRRRAEREWLSRRARRMVTTSLNVAAVIITAQAA